MGSITCVCARVLWKHDMVCIGGILVELEMAVEVRPGVR